ncbi:radical SAM protein [Desulfatiferula olefinivorans]
MRNDSKKNILLMYPPGRAFQRGEDRCQGNIEDSAATSIRACNDLGYVAAGLSHLPYRVMIRDYPAEKGRLAHLLKDLDAFRPDLVFISITHATIFDDLDTVALIRTKRPTCTVILKGALFFDADPDLLARLDLSHVDYLIGGECEFVAARLIRRHVRGLPCDDLSGILYKQAGRWVKTDMSRFEENLDMLRFPARHLMPNTRYKRPDTGEPQATISVARGCPSGCIYCLTPVISGKKLRKRSPDNVLAEMRECFHRYGIRQFFLKSDTFTLDAVWVKALCDKLIRSELHGHIGWVANSRTRPLDLETLVAMKQAGCRLVAFGFESGSDTSLKRMGKGATTADSRRAVRLAREAGLLIFGFYMAGFPWEDRRHLEATRRLIFDLDADFIEIHIPIPYARTTLARLCARDGLKPFDTLGRDYFARPATGTRRLTRAQLKRFRKRVLFTYYARPAYIAARVRDTLDNPVCLWNYGRYALRLLVNLIR